ncbi:hypothetical protein D1227_12580 [Henriciella mobilis]|nr:hypothetical protein D1227_12580 [Henriciella mobilis]
MFLVFTHAMSDLRTTIYVAIRSAPKRVRAGLRDRNPTIGDRAASELAEIVEKAVQRHLDSKTRKVQPPAPSVGGWAND